RPSTATSSGCDRSRSPTVWTRARSRACSSPIDAEPGMPLLEVRDLFLYYASAGRTVRAVDGVSFTIDKRGEAIGVGGESGSGKTSLATALMRLLPKGVARFDGSIRLDGQELRELSDEEFRRQIRWRRIAMVFQGSMNILNPVLKVGVQVAE